MSMNRIGQSPGRGSDSPCRACRTPVTVTAAAPSQPITPIAGTHDVDVVTNTMTPTSVMAEATYPMRRAQTASRQCLFVVQVRRLFHSAIVRQPRREMSMIALGRAPMCLGLSGSSQRGVECL